MGGENLSSVKAALREEIRRRLADMPARERGALAVRAEDHLLSLPAIGEAGTVLLFDAYGDEMSTTAIASRLLDAGKRVLLPFVEAGAMGAAELTPGQLVRSAYGPREPEDARPVDPGQIDMALVPGLAFDRSGRRLGRGTGLYDRYLPRLRADALRIGLAFSAQLVDQVPAGPHDEVVHLVVTDEGAIDCRSVQ